MADWETYVEDEQVASADQEKVKSYDGTLIDESLRRKLHSAYTFVRSTTENKKIFTLDHLIQERLDMLTAKTTRDVLDSSRNPYTKPRKRISRLDLLDTLLKDTNDICEHLKTKKEGQT